MNYFVVNGYKVVVKCNVKLKFCMYRRVFFVFKRFVCVRNVRFISLDVNSENFCVWFEEFSFGYDLFYKFKFFLISILCWVCFSKEKVI